MGAAKRKKKRAKKATGGYVIKRRRQLPGNKVKTPFTKHQPARLLWSEKKSIKENYKAIGLSLDPNFNLTKLADKVNEKQEKPFDIDDEVLDDVEGKEHLQDLLDVPEPAPPKQPKLGIRERWYFKRLHDKYGDNYAAMARDIKLNPNQYTQKECKKKVVIYINTYKKELDKLAEKGMVGYKIKMPKKVLEKMEKEKAENQKAEEKEKGGE